MKLIRRKRKPTPTQKALDVVGKVVRGLAAVRVLRSLYGTYRFARKVPLVLGGLGVAAIGALVARKVLGSDDGPETETWSPQASSAPAGATAPAPASPPPAAPAPVSPPPVAPAPEPAAEPQPAPELTPNPAETAGTGSPPVAGDTPEPPSVPTTDDAAEDAPPAGAGAGPEDDVVAVDDEDEPK